MALWRYGRFHRIRRSATKATCSASAMGCTPTARKVNDNNTPDYYKDTGRDKEKEKRERKKKNRRTGVAGICEGQQNIGHDQAECCSVLFMLVIFHSTSA